MTTDTDRSTTRRLFRNLLELLSDPDAQLEYEQEVPIANVPAELVEMWFSDHYHPQASWFAESFSAEERAALAGFNGFYSSLVDTLPLDSGVRVLQASEAWPRIMERAAHTLARLEPAS